MLELLRDGQMKRQTGNNWDGQTTDGQTDMNIENIHKESENDQIYIYELA